MCGVRRFPTRPAALPLALLLLALSTLFLFGGDREYFYRGGAHDWNTAQTLAFAENLSFRHNLLRFHYQSGDAAGNGNGSGSIPYPALYNRFPLGGYALVKLAILPFGEYAYRAKIYAGRVLMLLLLSGAVVLAYLSLARITGSRWDALTATLLAFSSYYILWYGDKVSNEVTIDLFAVMLAVHGMAVFVQEGRFRQLLVKSCVALALGWHVYAFLLPFIAFGLAAELLRSRQSAPLRLSGRLKRYGTTLLRSRYLLLGIATLLFGIAVLTVNFSSEYFALNGEVSLRELPSVASAFKRTGLRNNFSDWNAHNVQFAAQQFYRIAHITLPYALNPYQTRYIFRDLEHIDYPVIAVGVLALGACLAGLVGLAVGRRRGRMLLATLTVSGFCWAVPFRYNTEFYGHDFESVFFVGIPLAAFTLALLGLRRWSRARLAPFFAVAAVAVFVASVSEMASVGESPATLAVEAEEMADYAAIRELVEDRAIIFVPWDPANGSGGAGRAAYYFLAGKALNFHKGGDFHGGGDDYLLLLACDANNPALLTPANRHVCLYDWPLYDEWRRTADLGAPIFNADWQVYLRDDHLSYVSQECAHQDVTFFLHLVPRDAVDFDANRSEHGYNNYDFTFVKWGLVLTDGACVIERPIPDYDISVIRTGQFAKEGRIWEGEYALPAP